MLQWRVNGQIVPFRYYVKHHQNLKIKIDAIKNASREDKPVQVTNLDILKRLSKLETAVFGPNHADHDLY